MTTKLPIVAQCRTGGYTLIEVMVGLVLSLIVILALMTVFKNVVAVSVTSSGSSRISGQAGFVQAAMQADLQSAGFGVPINTTTDQANNLYVISAAKFSGGTLAGNASVLPTTSTVNAATGNALVWSYVADAINNPAVISCRGLLITIDSNNVGTLYALQSTSTTSISSCVSGSGTVTSTSMNATPVSTGFSVSSSAPFSVAMPATPCRPIGAAAIGTANTLLASLTLKSAPAADRQFSVCLINFSI